MEPYDYIISLVKDAGEVLLKSSKEAFIVTMKNNDPKDVVTAVDVAVSDFLVSSLKKEFPTYGIYSEEGSDETEEGEYVWAIDPIDGSSNFARHIPHFAICVGLLHKGTPVLGVVYNPVTRELFSFKKGEGAYLNGERIEVSKITELKEAYSFLRTGRKAEYLEWGVATLRDFLISMKKVGNLGSSALDLCFIAAKRVEVVAYGTLTTQDIAVAIGLVREAGGEVYTIDGEPVVINRNPQLVIATATHELFYKIKPLLHKELLPR